MLYLFVLTSNFSHVTDSSHTTVALDKICEPGTVARYLAGDGTPTLLHYQKPNQKYAYMPVEFAVAAFRFGHSMIRPSYALNRVTGTDATQPRIPLFSRAPSAQNLNGFPGTMPDSWGIDWGYFLDGLSPVVPIPTPGKPPPPQFKLPQPSYRIDALLVDPLADLPEFRARRIPGSRSWPSAIFCVAKACRRARMYHGH